VTPNHLGHSDGELPHDTDAGQESTLEMLRGSEGVELMKFGETLLQAGPAEGVDIAEGAVGRWVKLSAEDPQLHSLQILLGASQAAGVLSGRAEQSYAHEIIAANGLLDKEQLDSYYGLAKQLSQSASQGVNTQEKSHYVLSGLDAYRRGEQGGPDNFSLAVMALGTGACLEDPVVTGNMQDELNAMIRARTENDM
jgi:hypothetical protein